MADLKVKITGMLNKASTVKEINEVISKLEKDIKKVKLNTQIDDETLKTLAEFSKAMQTYAKNVKDTNKVIREEKKIVQELDGTIKETIKQYLKNGEVIEKVIEKTKKKNQEVEKEKQKIKELTVAYDQLGKKQKEVTKQTKSGSSTTDSYKNGYTDTTIKTNSKGQVTSVTTTQNLEQERKATEKLAESKQKLKNTLSELDKSGRISAENLAKLNRAIDNSQNINQTKKLEEQIKNLNRIKEQEIQLSYAQRQAELQVRNLQNSKKLDRNQNAQLNAYLQSVNSLTARTPQLQQRLRELNLQFREISTSAETARKSFGQLMSEAMTKYPVWLGATAVFMGIPRLVNSAIDTIVDLDSKLVSLQKVMSADTNFDNLMSTANESAKEFAKTLSEALDTYTEFARQGYSEEEIPLLSDAALVTSNVGEMEAGQSAQYLTSALIQMKLEASDAMSVIDKWNNVSNNNATTVEKLAQGYSKAASVAKTWGLDMDELNAIIGTVTASTKQSGTEVGNFIKNVLPRLNSQPAQDALAQVGVSMTDENGNLKDALEIYKEVSKEYVKLDQINKNIVAEGLAGKYHISRMSSLLENMSMVDKMMSDSQNSTNSALIENEKYMQSLEARIAKVKQSFQELALIVGKAFLTESFVQFLNGMSTLASIAGSMTSTFGGLPLLFGGVATAVLLMNKNFRTAVVEMSILRAGANGLTLSLAGLKTAFKGLLASTGVGLVFAGIGYGIEKLIGAIGDSRQELEEFESKNKQLLLTYKENRQSISSLADEYAKFDDRIKNGESLNTEDMQRYREVVNQLASEMPNLVIGEDEYGNKILASSSYIKSKTELLEKQLQIQEQIDAREQKQQARDDYKKASDNLKTYNKEQEEMLDNLNEKLIGIKENDASTLFFNEKDIKLSSIDEMIKRIDELEKKKNKSSNEKDQLSALKSAYEEYDMIALKIEDTKMAMQSASTDIVNSILNTDQSMSDSAKSLAKDFSIFLATSEDSSKKINSVMNNFGNELENDSDFKTKLNEYGKAIDEYREKMANGMSVKALEPSKKQAVDAFNEVRNAMLSLVKDGRLSDENYNKLSTQLGVTSNSALGLDESLDKLSQSTGMSKNELEAQLAIVPEVADSMDSLNDSISGTSEASETATGDLESLKNAISSVMQDVTDSYSEMSDEISPLNGLLESLAEGKSISANEAVNLIAKEKELANAFKIENGQIVVNEEAVIKLRDAKVASAKESIDAHKKEVQAQAEGLKTKLKNFGVEVQGILTVAQANEALAKAAEERAAKMSKLNVDETGAMHASTVVQSQYDDVASGINEIKSAYEALDQMSAIASTGLTQVGTSAESMSDSTDSASESTENATYVTDKYKQSLEKLNLEMAKLQAIQRKYPTYSKEYQDAIKKEIALTKEQIALNKTQQKDLNAQIKSGNIVSYGKTTNSSSSSSNTTASGSSTKAKIWNFFKSQGFSDSATAGIMGNLQQESNFSTSAYNSSSGASGLAQWLGGRLEGLKKYAKEKGTGWTNLQTQLEWLFKEMTGADATTKSIIDKNGGLSAFKNMSVDDAASLFEKAFERSGGSALSKRQDYADNIYKEFKGSVEQVAQVIKGFSGTITSTYGTRTRNGKTETHKGVDIAGKKGDAIGATTAGTVTYAGWGKKGTGYGGYGNVVAVTDANGKTYLYAHLDATKVKKGDKVSVNQTIGTMGNTGDSDGVHLHYEERTNGYGTDVDPMSSVQAARNGISTGDAADQASAIDDAKSQVNQLAQDALSLEEQLEELNLALVQSVLDGYDHAKEQYSDDLAQIGLMQTIDSENSKKWIDQQLKKEKIIGKQLDIEKKSISYLKDQIKNNKDLTEAQKAQLSDDLLQRTQDMISLEQQLAEERITQAEKIMDTYKQAVEAIKDAQIKAIDEMIDAINDEDATKEYEENLKKAQEERQKILDDIAKYSLDNSYEGQSKLKDLQEDLAEQDKNIADMQDDRAKEQRIDNLNDQKESIQDEYDNLVNDERKFAQMRSDIINGNTAQIEKDLNKYYDNVKANSKVMGQALSNNLVDLINQANRYLNGKDYKPIKVAKAKDGGLLPNWGGSGRGMIVHEGELISSKPDTKALFKVSEFAKSIVDGSLANLTRISIPKLPSLSPSTATTGDTNYHLSFGDLKVTGDANGAKTVMNEIVKGVKLLGGNI